MITLTRRNGTTFALNPDLIERVEATDGVCNFRAAVLIASSIRMPEPAPLVRLHSVSDAEE